VLVLPVRLGRRIFRLGIELVWNTESAFPRDSRSALLNRYEANAGAVVISGRRTFNCAFSDSDSLPITEGAGCEDA
jgi:hypothetical protein